MSRIYVRSAVDKGVRFLDDRRPGWYDDINLSTLDMAVGDVCVLGQLCESYKKGLDILGIEIGDESASYGFTSMEGSNDWSILTEEWRRVILAKRESVVWSINNAPVTVNPEYAGQESITTVSTITMPSEKKWSVTFNFAGMNQRHTLGFSSVEESNAFMLEAMTSGCTIVSFK